MGMGLIESELFSRLMDGGIAYLRDWKKRKKIRQLT